MGMFDWVECKYDLNDSKLDDYRKVNSSNAFQTKSMDKPCMNNYIISENGELFIQEITYKSKTHEEEIQFNNYINNLPDSKSRLFAILNDYPEIESNYLIKVNYSGRLKMWPSDIKTLPFDIYIEFINGKVNKISIQEIINWFYTSLNPKDLK